MFGEEERLTPFQYKPGGDAYDIVGVEYDHSKCPKCGWTGTSRSISRQSEIQQRLNERSMSRQSDTINICPRCYSQLQPYEQVQRREELNTSRKLFFINIIAGTFFGIVGIALYWNFRFGLPGFFVTFVLSVLALRLAWYSKKKNLGYGDVRPYKAGYMYALGSGILLVIICVIEAISYL
jgi:hypothetical protein